MAKFNERLRFLRKEKKLSQQEFANQIGISKSSINMYERGEREPGFQTLEAITRYFNVDMNYLMGKSEIRNSAEETKEMTIPENVLPMPKMKKIPLIGTIACGQPILAVEEASESVFLPDYMDADFSLRCSGDSMINARIFDGDIVYIRSQETVENGEIAAVIIGEEATLKRVYYVPGSDRITLRACNPMYADMEYEGETLNHIHILGKAVGFTSMIRL